MPGESLGKQGWSWGPRDKGSGLGCTWWVCGDPHTVVLQDYRFLNQRLNPRTPPLVILGEVHVPIFLLVGTLFPPSVTLVTICCYRLL